MQEYSCGNEVLTIVTHPNVYVCLLLKHCLVEEMVSGHLDVQSNYILS